MTARLVAALSLVAVRERLEDERNAVEALRREALEVGFGHELPIECRSGAAGCALDAARER